jgi:alcohol dehydrogenase
MRAARLHEPGKPMRVDSVAVPAIRPEEVLVRVEACGVISNMNAVFSGQYWYHLPPLPAVVGLDAAGVIEKTGEGVNEFKAGDRVYINPLLSCGSCHYCRSGNPTNCSFSAFRGYFAFSAQAVKLLEENPYGGFAEYTAAPARNLVKLPPEVSFELGARWGYLGTSFAALEAGGARGGSWVLINGVTGILGVGAVLWALGMGAARILGLGRNQDIMTRLKALAPRRIDTLALGERPIAEWARERTDGIGADMLLDCTGRGSPRRRR